MAKHKKHRRGRRRPRFMRLVVMFLAFVGLLSILGSVFGKAHRFAHHGQQGRSAHFDHHRGVWEDAESAETAESAATEESVENRFDRDGDREFSHRGQRGGHFFGFLARILVAFFVIKIGLGIFRRNRGDYKASVVDDDSDDDDDGDDPTEKQPDITITDDDL